MVLSVRTVTGVAVCGQARASDDAVLDFFSRRLLGHATSEHHASPEVVDQAVTLYRQPAETNRAHTVPTNPNASTRIDGVEASVLLKWVELRWRHANRFHAGWSRDRWRLTDFMMLFLRCRKGDAAKPSPQRQVVCGFDGPGSEEGKPWGEQEQRPE
jgi:hypothetical protein